MKMYTIVNSNNKTPLFDPVRVVKALRRSPCGQGRPQAVIQAAWQAVYDEPYSSYWPSRPSRPSQ